MGKPTKFDGMMHEICVRLGFCGGADGEKNHVVDFIPKTGPVSAGQFASWVLEAEGLPSAPNELCWRELRSIFIKHMGSETVDAAVLTGRTTGDN